MADVVVCAPRAGPSFARGWGVPAPPECALALPGGFPGGTPDDAWLLPDNSAPGPPPAARPAPAYAALDEADDAAGLGVAPEGMALSCLDGPGMWPAPDAAAAGPPWPRVGVGAGAWFGGRELQRWRDPGPVGGGTPAPCAWTGGQPSGRWATARPAAAAFGGGAGEGLGWLPPDLGDVLQPGRRDGARGGACSDARTRGTAPGEGARWHPSASLVGGLTHNQHVFVKVAGPRERRFCDDGQDYNLSKICMVYDESLRVGGIHKFVFSLLDGELGLADGAGFTFDTVVRRRPLWQMSTIFMNKRGFVCLRRGKNVSKLPAQLPKMLTGKCLNFTIDLDAARARFEVFGPDGLPEGRADVDFAAMLDELGPGPAQVSSGFFCAIVTGSAAVGLD